MARIRLFGAAGGAVFAVLTLVAFLIAPGPSSANGVTVVEYYTEHGNAAIWQAVLAGFGIVCLMGASVEEATRHLNDAVGCLSGKGEHPGDHAELMIKAARTVEHGLLAAFAALPRDGTSWDRTAALEVYRGYSDVEHALLRVADRTWYAVLRAM